LSWTVRALGEGLLWQAFRPLSTEQISGGHLANATRGRRLQILLGYILLGRVKLEREVDRGRAIGIGVERRVDS
jgi:hypothetical protein